MLINVALAVALGLVPLKAGEEVQSFRYKPSDYTGLIGHYHQSVDRRGITHLSGFDRRSGRPFDMAVDPKGHVEANVGEMYVVFDIAEG